MTRYLQSLCKVSNLFCDLYLSCFCGLIIFVVTILEVIKNVIMGTREDLIDSGVNLLTSAVSLADPVAGLVGAALSPIIASGAKSILPNSLSKREDMRVEEVFKQVVQKIISKLNEGKVPRSDDMYYANEMDIPNAQEIFEGVLLKAREEHQAKKLRLYSDFFANLCFDETINLEHAHFLLTQIERLTYRQFVILAYLSDGKCIATNRWDALFKVANTSELIRYYDFYSEYVDLYNIRLITQTNKMPGFALGMSETKISDMGLSLSKLLDLKQIPRDELNSVGALFDTISSVIERNHGNVRGGGMSSNAGVK